MRRPVEKVVVFVTRRRSDGQEMLVIRHPHAGLQIPAGTVDLGEPVETAVRREIEEETGLTDCELIAHMGSISKTTTENERIVLRTTKLFDQPANDASSLGFGLRRGSYVEVEGVSGNFSAVFGDPLDLHVTPVSRKLGVRGYVRSSVLGRHLTYHLYHLASTARTASKWLIQSDGVTFQVSWIPLVPRPYFNAIQDTWMDSAYSDLLNFYRTNSC